MSYRSNSQRQKVKNSIRKNRKVSGGRTERNEESNETKKVALFTSNNYQMISLLPYNTFHFDVEARE